MTRFLRKIGSIFILKQRNSKKDSDSRPSPKKKNAPSSGNNNNHKMMQTSASPTRRSRRLLSRVLDRTVSTTWTTTSQDYGDYDEYNNDDEKENRHSPGSKHYHHSNNSNINNMNMNMSPMENNNGSNTKGIKKVTMTWAELQRLNNSTTPSSRKETSNAATPTSYHSRSTSAKPIMPSSASDTELSPTAHSTCSAQLCGGRKGSDMKYSSIASDYLKHVPSAKTISDQFFPTASSASSASNSSVGLALSLVDAPTSTGGGSGGDGDGIDFGAGTKVEETKTKNKQKFRGGRARMLHERERELRRKHRSSSLEGLEKNSGEIEFCKSDDLSPETLRIMEEVEQAYQTSPIPASYVASPPKRMPLPSISYGRKNSQDGKKKGTVPKRNMDASTLLAKEAGRKGEKSVQNQSLKTNKASKQREEFNRRQEATKTADDSDRKALSAPKSSVDNVAKYLGQYLDREFSEVTPASSRSNSAASSTASSQNSRRLSAMPSRHKNSKNKPAALAVQREKMQRKQRLSDACDSNNVDGRRNLDKRTARLRYADAFKSDVMRHRASFPHLNNGTNHSDKVGSEIQDRGMNGVSIVVRKRPIFDYELDRGDYDVVSIDNSTKASHDTCIVHNCVMHPDMKQMLVKPVCYTATAAFDEHCSDDDIFRHVAEPLVMNAASGEVATLLMYGQTGCGKSHTMSGIESRTSHGLFHAIDALFLRKGEDVPVISLQFVELCGSKECKDLLDPKLGDVKLADGDDGSVRLLNAVSFEVESPEDLMARILLAKGRRATEATDKNGVSSRSHAVCQVQIKGKRRGVLTLIDCAGSERRHDSMYHSSERQKESAEINASLWALKECIRARASNNSRIPYRNSSLTRILRESFERENARLCVIACVAPNATDTEHTMETLKTVAHICGFEDKIKEVKAHTVTPPPHQKKKSALPPKMWDHEQLARFIAFKKMDHKVKLSAAHDGKALMKMSLPQMRAQLFEERDKDLAEKLFNLLRTENDRVNKIQRTERINLSNVRKGKV